MVACSVTELWATKIPILQKQSVSTNHDLLFSAFMTINLNMPIKKVSFFSFVVLFSKH
ncbi:unnamed protein product [Spirodela intermedia]|uniref:Uncharacterized protein n=1 Tax=Spirodela intermedia TaxID=51605 RepID=A0A7I8IKT7_SPIIN|nr:unnamed protein product [Spirodela intermedia]CAA6658490.1 unnamed protein product [Spirodela intermedia]